ncbi:hypothetical protein GDO81_010801 [Engystomops pustulosus]|uniref:Hexosyltransferase n=1 Tax=Engystomops pustulosus TaxID=76066 RepID=A0AAV7C324_ENGPU|nr:hypothetical protein GDO81_010801 [Engystomops pustulosus]
MKIHVPSFIFILSLAFLIGIFTNRIWTNQKKSPIPLTTEPPEDHPENKSPSYILPPHRESVTLNDGVNEFHLNFSRFQEEFPYEQDYVCKVILTPNIYHEPSKSLIILAVKSHPATSGRRNALRQTWAREWQLDGYVLRPVFLVGRTEVSGQMELVKIESKEYGDILQWDLKEGYHSLPLKERCLLEYIVHNLSKVAFIYKGDEDMYVNPSVLVNLLKTFGSNPLVLHGNVMTRQTVGRSGRNIISKYIFPGPFYPKFLSGGGFVYTGPSARLLYEVSQKIPVFPLDDVYFGFLTLAANLTLRHDGRFKVFGLRFEPCEYQKAVVIHGLSPELLVERWHKVESANCSNI